MDHCRSALPGTCIKMRPMRNNFFLLASIVLALFTLSSQCQKENVTAEKSNLTELKINLDQTAWFCANNCRYNFSFQEDFVTTRRYNTPNDENPIWTCTRPLSAQQWKAITDALDLEKLAATDATIGCPGCADEAIETLKVTTGQFSHEVRMNMLTEVPAIQDLLDELRGQAENYKDQDNCQ